MFVYNIIHQFGKKKRAVLYSNFKVSDKFSSLNKLADIFCQAKYTTTL